MSLDHRTLLLGLCTASLLACGGGSGRSSGDSGSTGGSETQTSTLTVGTSGTQTGTDDSADETGDDSGPQPGEQAPSARPRVKFKTAERYAADLSNALSLAPDALCSELDAFDCISVHRIALGEVDAFGLRLFEPLETMPITAPIAVDRIALSACGERAAQDFADSGNAASFQEVASGDASNASERDVVVARLYRQLLLREATEAETLAVASMYDDLPEDNRAQTWAQMACFVVATSTEALFY
ncbi:MAG: hypothetical protein KUG77_25265 [Nannocystaceae bacterium]|nr:hypothetical protein [Nannocystaceae bacterium]